MNENEVQISVDTSGEYAVQQQAELDAQMADLAGAAPRYGVCTTTGCRRQMELETVGDHSFVSCPSHGSVKDQMTRRMSNGRSTDSRHGN
jgi:hypothetical protein